MDPFSLTVGILSAADVAARVTTMIVGYLKDAKHASAERELLAKEAACLLVLLENVRDGIPPESSDSDVTTQQAALVEQFQAACDDLAASLGYDPTTDSLKRESRSCELRTMAKWFSTKKGVYATLERISRIEQHANTLLLTQQRDLLRHIDKRAQSAESIQLKKSLLNWLSTLNAEQDHRTTSSHVPEGSGKWFLSLPELTNWFSGKERLLWCYGIPGAGKTVIASIVVEELRKQAKRKGNFGVAFIYLKYDQPDQTFENVIGSLLRQLLAPDGVPIPDSLRKEFEASRAPTAGDMMPLRDLLQEMKDAMQFYQQVFIVIDAIDECRDQFRWQLVEVLQRLECYLIVTSRLPENTDEELGNFKRVEIKANRLDIESYIDQEINKDHRGLLKFVTRRPSLREEIKVAVVKNAEKMFLLARLHVDALKTALTINNVREILKSLPENLDETYDKAWERVDSQPMYYKTTARKTLGWLTHAFRPLSLTELQHALAIERGVDFDEDDIVEAQHIIDICAGLVNIDANTKRVNLVHFTTKKYLDQHRHEYFPKFHETITMGCAMYLSLPTLREATLWTIADSYPLACYAAQYMAEHARESPEVSLKPAVLEALYLLLSEPDKRKPLLSLLDGLDLIRAGAYSSAKAGQNSEAADAINSPLHISKDTSQVSLNVVDSAANMITRELAELPERSLEVTALHLAASMGLTSVAARLLNDTLNIDAVDETGKTPLVVAMEKGFEKAVELLINSGAQVDLRTEHGRGILLYAAERKWIGVQKMIIQRALNLAKVDADVALLVAANFNSAEIEVALDRARENPNNQDTNIMETAMFLSVEIDHLAAVEVLLRSGVDVNSKDHTGQTALHRATRCESESMIRTLIKFGAEIDVKNDSGKSPWRANIRHSNKKILNLLLTLGADPNTTSTGGESELYTSAASGDVTIVKYILESGGDPSIKTSYDWTPLHWAAHNGHTECVQLLIQAGADVNAVSDQAKTPLDMALSCNHEAIAALLMANGAKLHDDLQRPSNNMTHPPLRFSTVAPAKDTSANKKVTFIFDQPLDEGYQYGQSIYVSEGMENMPDCRPYQISHRLSAVTDSISIRRAQRRLRMAEYPFPPEKFPRREVLYDIERKDADFPGLKLCPNPDSPMQGNLAIRRTWSGNWQVYHEDEQGNRRMLFRTIEANWSSPKLDEACRWNDQNGSLLAISTVWTITFANGLEKPLLDILMSCWVAKLWSENLTLQKQEAAKRD